MYEFGNSIYGPTKGPSPWLEVSGSSAETKRDTRRGMLRRNDLDNWHSFSGSVSYYINLIHFLSQIPEHAAQPWAMDPARGLVAQNGVGNRYAGISDAFLGRETTERDAADDDDGGGGGDGWW